MALPATPKAGNPQGWSHCCIIDAGCAFLQTTMNLLLLGAASLPIGYMAFGFIALVVPPRCAC